MRILLVIVLALVGRTGVAADNKTPTDAIKQNQKVFRACYERELERDPKARLKGKVVLGVEIDKAGIVKDVRVDSTTINNRNVENCLLRAMLKQKFPPDMPARFRFPFVFDGTG